MDSSMQIYLQLNLLYTPLLYGNIYMDIYLLFIRNIWLEYNVLFYLEISVQSTL